MSRTTSVAAGVVLVASLAVSGAAWSAVAASSLPMDVTRTVTDAWNASRTPLDPTVAGYADAAALTDAGRFYLTVSRTEVTDADGIAERCTVGEPGLGVLGCFTTAGERVYLYDVTDVRLSALESVVAAHEMLHAAWHRYSPATRERLAGLLEQALERSLATAGDVDGLTARLEAYARIEPGKRADELYAILATEVPDLGPELEEHYARFFTDRSVVVALDETVDRVFAEVDAQLADLVAQVEALEAELETVRADYAAARDALEADVAAFNERARTAGGFATQEAFDRARASLLTRQDDLEQQRLAVNALVTEHNTTLERLQAVNAEAKALDRAVNIDATEQPTDDQAVPGVG